jgi:hypothetical protein
MCFGGWMAYTGLAVKGCVHRLVDYSKEHSCSKKKGNYINGLEDFCGGYLNRKLAARG